MHNSFDSHKNIGDNADVMIFSVKNFDCFLSLHKGKIIGAMFDTSDGKLTSGVNLIASHDFKYVLDKIRKNRFELPYWQISKYIEKTDQAIIIAQDVKYKKD